MYLWWKLSIALNRWVTSLAPLLTASSPWRKEALLGRRGGRRDSKGGEEGGGNGEGEGGGEGGDTISEQRTDLLNIHNLT